MSSPDSDGRRGFLRHTCRWRASAAATPAAGPGPVAERGTLPSLPGMPGRRNCRSLKQSSHDPAGGNADFRRIAPGGVLELVQLAGPGVISHLWFTIAAQSPQHLKELVLRAYWDGCAKPSVECPIGDFFGAESGPYQSL